MGSLLHITWGARILAHGWLSGYGQSYPIDTAWVTGCRRLLGSLPVHTRPGSPPEHTQLTLISWVASGAHPTHPTLPIQGWSPAIQEDFRGRGPASPGVCIDWQRIELQWPLISNRRSNLGGDGRCPRLADQRNGTMEKRLCSTLHSPRLLSHEGPGQTANFFVQRLTKTCTYCCIHSLPNK